MTRANCLPAAIYPSPEVIATGHHAANGVKDNVSDVMFNVSPLLTVFDAANDPVQVTLDCRHLSFVDYSAIAALETLRERYSKAGKHLRVLGLSERCKKLLKRARVQHD